MLLQQHPSHYETLYGLIERWHKECHIDTTKYLRTSIDLPMLESRYREPWRGYHAMDHIADGFATLLPFLKGMDKDRQGTLVRSWCFHDSFYAPGCAQNEYFSYLLAIRDLPSRFPQTMITVMAEHIMATRTHSVPVDAQYPEDTALMLDGDLKRLAGTPQAFMHDHELIVREYSEAYSEPAVIRGRREWAENFQKRESIYLTPHFSHLEDVARSNLANLVRVLS